MKKWLPFLFYVIVVMGCCTAEHVLQQPEPDSKIQYPTFSADTKFAQLN